MGRKKNSFSKAIKHLKSKNIDEKLEMLNEIPTNNTSSIYSVVPNSVTVGVDVPETVPDYSTIDFEIDGADGKDTSGLFDSSGNSKFIAPPGDNTYILGPMSAMYYTWSTPWTKIGYIRESDRRMVNLGTIYSTLHYGGDFNGKLSGWDGSEFDNSSNRIFYSNGQLTLEQAQWFLNTAKKDNAGNDPANANYRAFYPGPPSNVADGFGRYLCTITGTPKGTKEELISRNIAPMGLQGSDNFSAQNAKNRRGDLLSSVASFGRNIFNRSTKALGDYLQFGLGGSDWMVKGLKGTSFSDFKFDKKAFTGFKGSGPNVTDPRWIDRQAGKIFKGRKLADFADDLVSGATGGRWNPKFFQKLAGKNYVGQYFADGNNFQQAIDYAQGGVVVATEKIKSAPGWKNWFGGVTSRSVKGEPEIFVRGSDLAKNKTFKVFDSSTEAGRKAIQDLAAKTTKSSKVLKYAGRAVPFVGAVASGYDAYDRFQKGDTFGGVLSVASMMPGPVGWWALGAQVAYDVEGAVNKDGFKGTVTGSRFKVEGYLVEGVDSDTQVIPDIAKQGMYDHLMEQGVPLNDPVEYSKEMIAALSLEDVNPELIQIILAAINRKEYDKDDIEDIKRSMIGLSINLIAHRKKMMEGKSSDKKQVKEQRERVSLERRKEILKNLNEPVVLPETKQKSYKVKPGRRSKKSNYHQGMDKLIGDVKPQKSFKKPDNIWSTGWQEYNARSSQDKKNMVLEKIGEGKHALKYMLDHGTMMDAKNLEEFWGKNPDFYSYFFNGKKYKTVRKEQVKGDYVVFLVDEFGAKSSMLQSELNIKLIEEEEKKMLEEYNKLNNIESIPYEKDPLFKKVSKRLKKEIDYPEKPARKGYPNEPPPKLGPDGFHPDFGKKYKYDKLDPISATTMSNAPTGNPEIDANVKRASLKSKVKEGYSDWRSEIEKK